jgi:hypothetical protein
MYKDEKTILATPKREPNIFDESYVNPVVSSPKKEHSKEIEDKKDEATPKQVNSQAIMPELSLSENIDKIIIFFKNKTFVTLKPEE